MYLKRTIDKYLEEWKDSPTRKPLLLRGARQVGKSCSIRHLGEKFKYFIEINLERNPEYRVIFEGNSDVGRIIRELSLLTGVPIIEGETLLFIDEIQTSQAALKSLWFFKEDLPSLHVIGAGSLLEFAIQDASSFGVGRIRSMYIYPMSFREFVIANGKGAWIDAMDKATVEMPLPEVLHNELVKLFRTFLLTGGMPAVVKEWVTTGNFHACNSEQDDIINSYYSDFSKYSGSVESNLLRNTLKSVIMQTGGKITFSKVEGNYRIESVKKALGLLEKAGLIKRISYTLANGIPLGAETNGKYMKYIFLDTGLMLRNMNMDYGGVNLNADIMTSTASSLVNRGGIAEMYAGLELIKSSRPWISYELYYWENSNKGTMSEIDYVLPHDSKVLPLEVKSGLSGKMKSLRLFMEIKGIENGIRTSLENFSKINFRNNNKDYTIEIIPLYAISRLTEG